MKIEILDTHAGTDGKQGVRGSIEANGDAFLVSDNGGLASMAEGYQRQLAVKTGQITMQNGNATLTGTMPSAEATLRYMIEHKDLAGKIREV